MRTRQPAILLCMLATLAAASVASATEVAMCTDAGRIVIELKDNEAPLQVANFLDYVENGHYTGTVFHRVIADFMIQAGGFDRSLAPRAAAETVENESRNGLNNNRGTVAAARTGDPHSASAQFFINTVDNPYLNASRSEWGYTVFGEVTEGMDVVESISRLPTGPGGPFPTDVPTPLITILAISVLDRAALAGVDGPDLQAALLARIDVAEETDSPAEALQWITHYRASCAPAGPDLLVTEARHAVAVNANLRAVYALEEFFATAPESHRDYDEAVDLYEVVAPGSQRSATSGSDACVAPEAPVIPDGTRETLDGMLAAQSEVQTFMASGTSHLRCLDEIIETENVAPETRATAIEEYNRMVDLTQQVGDDFNRQVRAFRARQ